MNRSNYVMCIRDNREDKLGKTLCSRHIHSFEFTFTGLDHWFYNRQAEGRLLGCEFCVHIAKETMNEEKSLHEE